MTFVTYRWEDRTGVGVMTIGVMRVLLLGQDLAAPDDAHRDAFLKRDIQVISRSTLDEASPPLREGQVDVVVLHLDAPESDQIEMIAALRALTDQIPIVVISESQDPNFAPKAIQHGAQDVFFSKSADPEVMQGVLLTAIERKRLERHLLSHARKDELTGLANRSLLEERFARAMARADRQATLVALVAIDLDQPEELVGRYGPDVVDRLMPMIGQRLMHDIRETDTLARTRDTGFTWLVEGLAMVDDISILVDRVPRLLAESFMIDGRSIRVTVSIGIAVSPFHGRDFPTLLTMAEAAMLDVATMRGDGLLMPPILSLVEGDKAEALAL